MAKILWKILRRDLAAVGTVVTSSFGVHRGGAGRGAAWCTAWDLHVNSLRQFARLLTTWSNTWTMPGAEMAMDTWLSLSVNWSRCTAIKW